MTHLDGCSKENIMRKKLEFPEDQRDMIKSRGFWAPFSHHVMFCMECSRIVAQEDNSARKSLSYAVQQGFGK
jgi:hypothetical protein